MSFWKLMGNSAASAALATASDALKGGGNWQTVGVAAGVGLLGGLLTVLLTHQAAQHPVVQAAGAQVLQAPVPAAPAQAEAGA